MLSWNEAYERINESTDFRMLFGRMFAKDEFRYYAYGLKFNSIPPALLAAASTTPNTATVAATRTGLSAPTTNLVPGTAVSSSINFPAGAVILGFAAVSLQPQRVTTTDNTGAGIDFKYSSADGSRGRRDLFQLSFERIDGESYTQGLPIDQVVINPNSAFRGNGVGMAEALLGGGSLEESPTDPIIVTPGISLVVSVQSLALPCDLTLTGAGESQAVPSATQSVHVVFHCMIPGTVTKRRDQ